VARKWGIAHVPEVQHAGRNCGRTAAAGAGLGGHHQRLQHQVQAEQLVHDLLAVRAVGVADDVGGLVGEAVVAGQMAPVITEPRVD
jgi:hypothetical protein